MGNKCVKCGFSDPRALQIDHINGDGMDNRWINLRAVTHLENCKNVKLLSSNKSGCAGVSYQKDKDRWRAEIYDNNKRIYLGSFKDKQDAINARNIANIKYGYHKNHGSIRDL